jgi:hypothetical protein
MGSLEVVRRPLRLHAPTPTALKTEGPLHASWALYKKGTAITALNGEDWIELCNAAVDISWPSSRLSSVLSSRARG